MLSDPSESGMVQFLLLGEISMRAIISRHRDDGKLLDVSLER